ncbi:hypothetical protein M8J76_012442 [Diaphorina citri]|nr:hypothetical protein M8J75_007041 [Diaphorina citri]KAI5722712.1 hypothetical protein M8J76_012442 [Diaphorina citri]
MPRSKTGVKKPPVNSVGLVTACEAVLNKTLSYREACAVFNVSLQTLFRFVKKTRDKAAEIVEYKPQYDHQGVHR